MSKSRWYKKSRIMVPLVGATITAVGLVLAALLSPDSSVTLQISGVDSPNASRKASSNEQPDAVQPRAAEKVAVRETDRKTDRHGESPVSSNHSDKLLNHSPRDLWLLLNKGEFGDEQKLRFKQLYRDKVVSWSGRVSFPPHVAEDGEFNLMLEDDEEMYFWCKFDKSQAATIANVKVDEKLSVVGTLYVYIGNIFYLTDCTLSKTTKD